MNTPAHASDNLSLDDFETVQTAEIALRDPQTGAPTSARVTLAGPEHPVHRRILLDRNRRMRASMMKTGRVQLDDPEDEEVAATDMLVACTLGWSGLTRGGHPLVFSPDEARKLYSDPARRWLRDQVQAALNEAQSFIRRSAAS